MLAGDAPCLDLGVNYEGELSVWKFAKLYTYNTWLSLDPWSPYSKSGSD